jgi:D-alanyl-D-alanine carboxypeptidase
MQLRALLLPAGLTLALVPARPQNDIGARLEGLRIDADVPALGAALVTVDGLQGVWVTGLRSKKNEAVVTTDDLWHLGSCTKAMTATLIALLVERGDLAWDTTLSTWFTDLPGPMAEGLRDVTLVELLGHRAGIDDEAYWRKTVAMRDSQLSLVVQRQLIAEEVLTHPPLERGAYLYSNTGYILAGHVAEVVTGRSWENLMQELLFRPLGMKTAGFGPPGTRGVWDQPRGHYTGGKSMEPSTLSDNPAALGPAGTVHASLADWARFVQLHLQGERGDVKVGAITLHAATFQKLHTELEGPGEPYALGWAIRKNPWAGGDGKTLWHDGSNNLWYCATWLGIERGVAVLVTANERSTAIEGTAKEVARLLLEEVVLRAADRMKAERR